jgi:uncharacterized protein (TIGR01777 family)
MSTSSTAPLRILVSGALGLVGRRLVERLRSRGRDVHRLVRRPPRSRDEIAWDPPRGLLAVREVEGFDAVIHLAGENVAAGRWTPARRAAIRDSRVLGTGLLARRLAEVERRPRVLVSASAIGFYGDRGDEVVDASSAPGTGFLPSVCREWEAAADPARAAGLRVVHPRIGVVLATEGGALARMLPPFRWCLGGRLGSGRQWMSWIALEDLVSVLETAVADERLAGPVDAVAPEPVRNADFSRALARALGRPALAPVPAPLLRALAGGLADELLLASLRVRPSALQVLGFRWGWPTLDRALAGLLGRAPAPVVARA